MGAVAGCWATQLNEPCHRNLRAPQVQPPRLLTLLLVCSPRTRRPVCGHLGHERTPNGERLPRVVLPGGQGAPACLPAYLPSLYGKLLYQQFKDRLSQFCNTPPLPPAPPLTHPFPLPPSPPAGQAPVPAIQGPAVPVWVAAAPAQPAAPGEGRGDPQEPEAVQQEVRGGRRAGCWRPLVQPLSVPSGTHPAKSCAPYANKKSSHAGCVSLGTGWGWGGWGRPPHRRVEVVLAN